MLIIPAIDIYGGHAVRLRQGSYASRTVYHESPLAAAGEFAAAGFGYLHLVDLEGAADGTVTNWDTLAEILALDGVSGEVGGGVRTVDEIERLIELGADRVVVGSVAAENPSLLREWVEEFGAARIAVALDLRDGEVATRGWRQMVPVTPAGLVGYAAEVGLQTVICTDIVRDGMLAGPNVDLYAGLVHEFPSLSFIASGGISSTDDLTALDAAGVAGAVIGKAIYEGSLTLEDLAGWVRTHGEGE
ncbi:MAG: 1-(5-phosphoribosyl)-5-[(5-phosphoribosylamino)methylideneamino]imidazole-4-carboxamide isomerase [Bacteroidetes bacterium]|nr:1-(5-phosphoribosyl)-5-[(5-phosphoribosylamino)methylideneamino]imidazole-4-carboxamide isomerase [Bacteroidota bacterium]